MGFRRRFGVRLVARIVLLLLALGLASLLAAYGRAPTAMLLAVGSVLVLTIDLWRLVNESNIELARFAGAGTAAFAAALADGAPVPLIVLGRATRSRSATRRRGDCSGAARRRRLLRSSRSAPTL